MGSKTLRQLRELSTSVIFLGNCFNYHTALPSLSQLNLLQNLRILSKQICFTVKGQWLSCVVFITHI